MYLVGMMGQNMIYNIIGTGLYFYFQSVIFIPAMAISIFMAVARVWDAINDPMMGTLCGPHQHQVGQVPTVFAVFTGRYYGDHHTDLL